MIATDRFVYVHLHKSGGTFVNECLMRFLPGARRVGYHLPRSRIPESLRALPVLGFVRNPWSYYVSWFSFQSRMPQPNALFRCASENRALDFSGTIRNLLDLGSGNTKLDQVLAMLPKDYGNQGLNLPAFALDPIRDSGKGFYSYLYDYMYGGGESPASVGKVETLRTDLRQFLAGLEIPLSPALTEFIDHAHPRNTSSHRSWRDYYDDELAALVAMRDQDVVKLHGYRFED
ncbi:hypothetical protein [Dokdonella sp.]|uniref:hypothetical protein n=1 Tax=Dokdonella sp. TaxID=2291710 RepID=UPI003C6AF750